MSKFITHDALFVNFWNNISQQRPSSNVCPITISPIGPNDSLLSFAGMEQAPASTNTVDEKQHLKKLKTEEDMSNSDEVRLTDQENDILIRAEDEEDSLDANVAPRRLRRAETVLRNRTGRIILILPQLTESFTQQAMIRTAESLGIQYIYTLRPKDSQRMSRAVMKGSKSWVTIVSFASERELIEECKKGEMWVLASNHLPITLPDGSQRVPLPLTPTLFASHTHRFAAPASDAEAVQQWQQQVITHTNTPSTPENPISHLQPPVFPKTSPGSSVFGFPSPLHLLVSEDILRSMSLVAAADKLVFMPRYGYVSMSRYHMNRCLPHERSWTNLTYSFICMMRSYPFIYPFLFLCSPSFALDGFTPSVALAMVVDRCFLLCPEARGSLTPEQRQQVRTVWYENLASTPQHRVVYQQWLSRADTIEPLEELRLDNKVPMRNARLKKKLEMLNEANRVALAQDGLK